jgi:hypothetical protein
MMRQRSERLVWVSVIMIHRHYFCDSIIAKLGVEMRPLKRRTAASFPLQE